MTSFKQYHPKPLFEERMKKLINDYEDFMRCIRKEPPNSIRCNTLKISVEELKKRLEAKGWKLCQPMKNYPEAMLITNRLQPGELGRSLEHTLGYYYVQDLSSMLPIIALSPQPGDSILDITAAPGSKTTQAVMHMKNQGVVFANDNKLQRIKILVSNLEKSGAINTIVTQGDAVQICSRFQGQEISFDKILVDASCSGEGVIRSSPKTFLTWNLKMIQKLSRQQKLIASSALNLLKKGGTLVYSTCTHAPEENEEVVQHLLDNFKVSIEKLELPLKSRPGLTEWNSIKFNPQIKNTCRIYPQDNDTEGFFLGKLKKND